MNRDYREMGARLKPLHRTKAAEGDGSDADGVGEAVVGVDDDIAPAGWWGEVKRREGVSKWILTHPLSVGVI